MAKRRSASARIFGSVSLSVTDRLYRHPTPDAALGDQDVHGNSAVAVVLIPGWLAMCNNAPPRAAT
jgi:hypothetical protein